MSVPRLHVLTDDRADPALLGLLDVVLDAGAPCIQLRSKGRDDASLHHLAEQVVRRCRAAGAVCLVNDRADVAVAVGADGVHVGAHDLPVDAVRRVVGPDLLVGATARDADEATRAAEQGADYLGVGPLYTSTTKLGLPAPSGPARIAAVTAAVDLPVLGIAGVTVDRVAEVVDAGAHGVAVTAAVTGADDPAATVRSLLAELRLAGAGRGGRP